MNSGVPRLIMRITDAFSNKIPTAVHNRKTKNKEYNNFTGNVTYDTMS